MAKFIAVSGPSSTGKSEIVEKLSEEIEGVVIIRDLFDTVWQDIVDRGLFNEWDDISKDTDFLCVFIIRMLEYYNMCLEDYADEDTLVVFDCCWLDLSIYATLNMWYTHLVREVQESIMHKLSKYDDRISRIYITQFDESKQSNEKYHIPFKRSNVKQNRKLEIEYYHLAGNFKNAMTFETTDADQCVADIVKDLEDLGYIQ